MVQEFEGLATEPYEDVVGKWTVGYGHLLRSGEPRCKITEADAVRLLCNDMRDAEACVEGAVDVPLTQNQADALYSFVFNLGCARLLSSTLLKKLNAKDYAGAAAEFPKWCRAGGRDVPGLLRRRLAEQLLFNTP